MALFKIYEEGHAALFPVHLFLTPWSHHLAPLVGEPLKSLVCVFRDGSMAWYAEPEEQTRLSKELLRRLLHEGLFEVVDRNTRMHLARMQQTCIALEAADFSKMDDAALARVFFDYCRDAVQLNAWGMLVTLLEMGQSSVITEEAYRYFSGRAKAIGQLERVSECVSVLCTPTQGTFLWDKRVAELHAARICRAKGTDDPEVRASVDALHRDFAWVSYGYVGPALDRGHLQSQVDRFSEQSDLERLLEETLAEFDVLRKTQESVQDEFRLDPYGRRLFHLARTFMFQKELRKQMMYRSFHALERLRKDLARRSGLPLSDTAWLLPHEFVDALGGQLDLFQIRARRELCVVLPFEEKILIGQDAGSFVASLWQAPVLTDVDELCGQCAYPHALVTGRVCRVFTAHDLVKLQAGDVLVSPATSPIMVPAMRLAGAIVTDQGGLTCHAAIVARELKKPCVIGTKMATVAFKDGDVVEVDAIAGVVRKVNG